MGLRRRYVLKRVFIKTGLNEAYDIHIYCTKLFCFVIFSFIVLRINKLVCNYINFVSQNGICSFVWNVLNDFRCSVREPYRIENEYDFIARLDVLSVFLQLPTLEKSLMCPPHYYFHQKLRLANCSCLFARIWCVWASTIEAIEIGWCSLLRVFLLKILRKKFRYVILFRLFMFYPKVDQSHYSLVEFLLSMKIEEYRNICSMVAMD